MCHSEKHNTLDNVRCFSDRISYEQHLQRCFSLGNILSISIIFTRNNFGNSFFTIVILWNNEAVVITF